MPAPDSHPHTATQTAAALSPHLLAAIALDFASSATFSPGTAPARGERYFERVNLGSHFDIWLIRWGADSGTSLHDHGGSAGAFVVVEGRLVEYMPNPAGTGRRLRRELHPLDSRPMAPGHIHTVVNEAPANAASVHVYSPPLVSMRQYEEAPSAVAPQPRLRGLVDHDTLPANDPNDR
jgi:hypothetical protein